MYRVHGPPRLVTPLSKVKDAPSGSAAAGVAQQRAQVEEVLLRGGALGEADPAPLADEVGRRHVAGASRGCGEARRFSPVVLVLDLRLSG